MLLEIKRSICSQSHQSLDYFICLDIKHQCHPLSDILIRRHDVSKYKTEIFTKRISKMWTDPSTVCRVTPFQKELVKILNPDVFLLDIKPFPVATLHDTIVLQMNNPHHLANHMPALTDGFSGIPFVEQERVN